MDMEAILVELRKNNQHALAIRKSLRFIELVLKVIVVIAACVFSLYFIGIIVFAIGMMFWGP